MRKSYFLVNPMDLPNSTLTNPQTLHAIVAQIRSAGLMAMLRADQPVDLLVEVGDALLAAPVLAVAIPMDHPEATVLLTTYRKRYGTHLLIGAGAITLLETGFSALAHGAEFLLTTRYETALHTATTHCGALYIPPATAMAALPALAAMGVFMATMRTSLLDKNFAWPHHQSPALLATDADLWDATAHCARTGAAAMLAASALFPSPEWHMPTMIRKARQLRQSWFAEHSSA